MTDSFISETSAWGRMLYWKDRIKKGREEITWIFIISFDNMKNYYI